MLLSPSKFRENISQGQLRLALVGMSNSGKSTCTRLLADEPQFACHEVDEFINRSLGIESMEQAAQWMGYPFEPKYAANEKLYLQREAEFTRVEAPAGKNFVLDTTGSIIYGKKLLLDWIAKNFLIVGLKVSDQLRDTLIEDFFSHPKTVIWGNDFSALPGEQGIDAIRRCYPILLKNRSLRYAKLADIEIPSEVARDPKLCAANLLKEIESKLKNAE